MPQNVYVSSVSSVDITDARAIHLGFDNVIYLRNRYKKKCIETMLKSS